MTVSDRSNAELVDELHRLTEELNQAYLNERRTRMTLLQLHAFMGITVGFLVFFTGTASFFEDQYGLWTRALAGGLALGSGLLLLVGLYRHNGKYTLEIVGLILMGVWDALMAIAIAALMVTYREPWVFPFPGHSYIPAAQPRPYAVMVYGAFAAMVWGVHLRAVLRDRRQSRV